MSGLDATLPPPVGDPGWLALAMHPATVRRALLTAAVVGTLLVAINHGDAILRGEVGRGRLARIALTVLVPYAVSTVSSASTRRELARAAVRSRPQERGVNAGSFPGTLK